MEQRLEQDDGAGRGEIQPGGLRVRVQQEDGDAGVIGEGLGGLRPVLLAALEPDRADAVALEGDAHEIERVQVGREEDDLGVGIVSLDRLHTVSSVEERPSAP